MNRPVPRPPAKAPIVAVVLPLLAVIAAMLGLLLLQVVR